MEWEWGIFFSFFMWSLIRVMLMYAGVCRMFLSLIFNLQLEFEDL